MKIIIQVVILAGLLSSAAFSGVTGKAVQRYPDGRFKEITYYNDNKETAKEYFEEKGGKVITGKLPDGTARIYFENGALEAEENYRNNKLNGSFKLYYDNGKLKEETSYTEDKKEGQTLSYDENGRLLEEGNYKEGKKDGLHKFYEPNGRLSAERNYKEDELNGSSKLYYDNGELSEEAGYKDGKKEGQALIYDDKGQIKQEEIYKDGKCIYLVKGTYENGKLKEEWSYKETTKEGLKVIYYPSGQVRQEGNYRDGKLNGAVKGYFENGKLREEWNYKDDKKDGLDIMYYPAGQIKQEGNYKDGKLNGMCIGYYENGKMQFLDTYKDGVKLNTKKYDTQGNWILNQNYPDITDNGDYGASDKLAEYLLETGKLNILDRVKMNELLKEHKFQLLGCTQAECAAEIGRILNVKLVISGSISIIAREFLIVIRTVNTDGAKTEAIEIEKCEEEKDLWDTIKKMAQKISTSLIEKHPSEKLIPVAVLDMEMIKE